MIADATIRCPNCAAGTRQQWLAALRKGDVVLVRNGAIHFRSC